METIINNLINNNVNIFVEKKIKQMFPKLLNNFKKCK